MQEDESNQASSDSKRATPRFDVLQLLMFVALVAVIVAFTQSEGCGKRIRLIECVSVSDDGNTMLVSSLSGRYANTPGKIYKADVSRTISLINTQARSVRSIHQDFRPGNCGPAQTLWWPGRTSAILLPKKNRALMQEFGGGDVLQFDLNEKQTAKRIARAEPVLNLAVSRSGNLYATCNHLGLSVCNTTTHQIKLHKSSPGLRNINAPAAAFSSDDSMIAAAGHNQVVVWDVLTGKKIGELALARGEDVYDVDFFPDNSLLVCTKLAAHRWRIGDNTVSELSGLAS